MQRLTYRHSKYKGNGKVVQEKTTTVVNTLTMYYSCYKVVRDNLTLEKKEQLKCNTSKKCANCYNTCRWKKCEYLFCVYQKTSTIKVTNNKTQLVHVFHTARDFREVGFGRGTSKTRRILHGTISPFVAVRDFWLTSIRV